MTVELPTKRPGEATIRSFYRLPPRALLFSLKIAAALSITVSSAIAQRPAPDLASEPLKYPVGDAVDVYNAVLDFLYVDGKEHPPVIVLYEVAARSVGGPCPFGDCKKPWPHKSKIDTATVLAYARPNLRRPPLINFGYRIPIVHYGDRDFERIGHDGYAVLVDRPREKVGPLEAFWAGFRRRFPKAWGYAMLSQVAFNPDHTEALIGVMQRCGESCGSTEAIFLKRSGNRWEVIERIPDEVETSQTSGSLRYRGPRVQNASETEVLVANGSSDNKARGESEDAIKVYRTVLDKLYTFYGESPGRVVIVDTYAGNAKELPTHRSKIDSATIASYGFLGQVREAVNPRFNYRIPVTWLNEDALKQLESEGQPMVKRAEEIMLDEQWPTWLAFNARYPDAWGYVRLGKVALNRTHTQSLVLTQHFCGRQCVNTDIWFLERKADAWYVVERMSGENSSYWGLDGLRYLGPDADPRAYKSRRVQGVLSDAQTGVPLRNTEIEVARPGQSSMFVRTDKEGRYILDKLARTPLTLKVKCRPPSQGKVVLGGIAVTPGLDSTFNAQVDFASCSQQ